MDKVTLIDLLPSLESMAKRKSLTKAQRDLTYLIPAGPTGTAQWIDTAQSLSIVNRKLFSQEKCYGISDIQFYFQPSDAYDTLLVQASVMGDTWTVHNSWTKAKALFHEMQELVLADNPSVRGTWADFKVFITGAHRTANVTGTGNLIPVDKSLPVTYFLEGEWKYARYVLPEHNVDPVTGLPLPADETYAHMIGADQGSAPNWQSVGLINAYQESRATVQTDDPNVPPGMSTSFFNQLTDSGSQEPELADTIENDNDRPPYDLDNYPGGGGNGAFPVIASFDMANQASPNGHLSGFVAQCGVIQLDVVAFLNGAVVASPDVIVKVAVAPGMYKGVAAIDMGQ